MKDFYIFLGPSLSETVFKGLEELGLLQSEVSVSVVRPGRDGFLGFFKRPWVVALYPRKERIRARKEADAEKERRRVWNEIADQFVPDTGGRSGVVLNPEGKYEFKFGSKTNMKQMLLMQFIVQGEIMLTRTASARAKVLREVFSAWAGLSTTEWTVAHKQAFGVAGLHYLGVSKHPTIKEIADYFSRFPSMRDDPLPDLPAPWTQEIESLFDEMFGRP